jgi:hypothetical protein
MNSTAASDAQTPCVPVDPKTRGIGIRWLDVAALAFTGGLGFALLAYTGFSQELVLQRIFQGVLIGAVSIFVYSRAVASLGAVETALFTTAVPCVTTVAAVFLPGEAPSGIAWGGVVIVTVGAAISLNGGNQPSGERDPQHQPDDFFTKYSRTVRRGGHGDDGYRVYAEIEERRIRRGGHGDDAYRLLAEIEEERSWWGRKW